MKKGGRKHDKGKPMMGLISSDFLIGLAKVLTYGAKKYAKHNWRLGLNHSRCYDALQRHLVDYSNGHDYDIEPSCRGCKRSLKLKRWVCEDHSGEHLLDNAACELMFLREMVKRRPDLDDRWKHAKR